MREYSDTLLIFEAKSRMPELYREHFDAKVEGSVQLTIDKLNEARGRLEADTPAAFK